MFETVFGFLGAVQKGGLLLAGGFLALLGGFIIINNMHWQWGAVRMPATIIGVRRDDRMFYPVYRYITPAGDTIESVSDSGSTILRGKETGRDVILRAFADDPQNFRSDLRGNFLIGLVFLLPGIALLYAGWDDNLFSPTGAAAAGAVLLIAVLRLRKIFIPRKDRLDKEDWKKTKRAERKARFDKMELTTIEAWQQSPGGRSDAAQKLQAMRITMPLMLAAGVLLLGLAYNSGQRVQALQENGRPAAGYITGFESRTSDNSTVYHAIVRFDGPDGRPVHFTDAAGSSHPRQKAGDTVRVLYLNDDPAGSALVDRGSWLNWIGTGLMAGMGTLLLIGAGLSWRSYCRLQTV